MRRLLLAVVVALAVPATASAAAPLNLDPAGHRPRVTVSNGGSGFFTWTTPSGAADVFHYCRVPQGGSACNATKTYAPADTDVSGGYALLTPEGVILLDARCCSPAYAHKVLFASGDGGATFLPASTPGDMNQNGDNIQGGAVYGPPGSAGRGASSIFTVSDVQTVGISFQATPTGTSPENRTVNLGAAVGASYQGSIALQGTSTLVATMATLDKLYWRKWTSGDVNTPGAWSAPVLLDTTNVNSTTKLVSGPSGLYVAYSTGAAGHARFVLRKFTGAGWSGPTTLSDTSSPNFGDLVEDSTGRLHFAWQDTTGRLRYRYARSAANTSFTQAQVLGPANENHPFLKLGVNAAGRGWITWEDIPGVRAQAIAPGEPPYNGPTKKTSKDVGKGEVFMKSPKLCVGPGQLFYVKVKKDGKVTIEEVTVSVDGKKVGTDSKSPFKVAVPTAGLAHGAHTLKAKVTVHFKKNGKKHTAEKTLSTGFSIC